MTGLVDLEQGPAAGPGGRPHQAAVDGWLQTRPFDWLAQVGTVALDPGRGYASALVAPLGHASVVGDHVHAIRLANAVAEQARRQVKQVIGAAPTTRRTASASCW
jgi:protein-L-isoaspartate O-methyltransferase